MDFNIEIKKYQQEIEEELEKYIRNQDCLEKKLNESVKYSLMAGGKRLRPILVLAAYKLFKENYDICMPYAVAIEMVHNASLIHDDLPGIDNDDFRHGKPTNHKQYNEATAILAGDSLFNDAYIAISKDMEKTKDEETLQRKIKIFNEFSLAVDSMLIGEFIDTECEWQSISKEDLEYIHNNKTGAFLKVSARMGAILGGATEEDLKNITTYAEKIGLAFQIKDDILSEEGDEKVLGKPVGNDKEMGKCTYVSIYGLEKSKEILEKVIEEAKEELNIFGEKADFLKGLAEFIQIRNK